MQQAASHCKAVVYNKGEESRSPEPVCLHVFQIALPLLTARFLDQVCSANQITPKQDMLKKTNKNSVFTPCL